MQKKNKASTLTLVLLLLVMVTLGTLGGTFAKYTSSAKGTDSARVAKWSIKVSDADMAQTDTFTIDLFNTAYNNDNVKSKGTDNVVAPGTTGQFAFDVENASEVTAQYKVDFAITNAAGIPIKFSVDGGTTWSTDLSDVDFKTIAMGAKEKITIDWKWETATDAADTALGKVGTDTITVEATLTAEQVI